MLHICFHIWVWGFPHTNWLIFTPWIWPWLEIFFQLSGGKQSGKGVRCGLWLPSWHVSSAFHRYFCIKTGFRMKYHILNEVYSVRFCVKCQCAWSEMWAHTEAHFYMWHNAALFPLPLVSDTSLAEEDSSVQGEKVPADDKWLCSLTTFLTDP